MRARRGDARAYESLVQEHQAIAFRTAYVITGSAADAEEAAQEAFVRAWLALRRFRQGAEFRPWLLASVALYVVSGVMLFFVTWWTVGKVRAAREGAAIQRYADSRPDDALDSPSAGG